MPRPGTKHYTYYPCPEALKILSVLPVRKRSMVIDHVLLAISRVSKAFIVKPEVEKDVFDYFGISENAATKTRAPLNERIIDLLKGGEKKQAEISRSFRNTLKPGQLVNALLELQALGIITRREGVSTGGRCPVLWSLVDNMYCP